MSKENKNKPKTDKQKPNIPLNPNLGKQEQKGHDAASIETDTEKIKKNTFVLITKKFIALLFSLFQWIFKNSNVVTNWLMVIITAILAIYTYELVDASIKQSSANIEAVKIAKSSLQAQLNKWQSDSVVQYKKDSTSIAIAETSAQISIRSILSIERSTKIQTSPYVGVTIIVTEPLVVGKDFAYEVNFINTGQTPAYNFSMGVKHDWGSKTEIYEINKTPVEIFSDNTILNTGEGNGIMKPRRIDKSIITQEFVDNVKSNLWDIQVRIAFRYKTKWSDIETFRPEPSVYAIGRNAFMNVKIR